MFSSKSPPAPPAADPRPPVPPPAFNEISFEQAVLLLDGGGVLTPSQKSVLVFECGPNVKQRIEGALADLRNSRDPGFIDADTAARQKQWEEDNAAVSRQLTQNMREEAERKKKSGRPEIVRELKRPRTVDHGYAFIIEGSMEEQVAELRGEFANSDTITRRPY